MPARSGGDILFSSLLGEKAKDMVFVRSETLTWACRFTEWGRRATILGTKENILAAVTPPTEAKRALPALQGLLGVFPKIEELAHVDFKEPTPPATPDQAVAVLKESIENVGFDVTVRMALHSGRFRLRFLG